MFDKKEYVYAVYMEKSFTAAAAKLYVSQPCLSAAIKKIEQQIGRPLFERRTGDLTPTKIGYEYLACAQKMMEIEAGFSRLLDDINNMKMGDIRIGGTNYVCSYILPLIVSRFSALYPGVDLSIYEANSIELEKMLQNDRVDLIIDSYDTKDDRFEYTALAAEKILLAVPAAHACNTGNRALYAQADELYDGRIAAEQLQEIDLWMISRMNDLSKTVRKAYDDYEFHIVSHEISNFCTTELSKLYIDITKDRVYTEKADSLARRSAQTVMYFVLSGMIRLLAPVLAFSAEEMWQAIPHTDADEKASVYLNDMPAFDEALTYPEIRARWDRLFDMRDDVMKALEIARANKMVGKSLEAKIALYTKDADMMAMLEGFGKELNTVFIVSGVALSTEDAPEGALTDGASGVGVLVSPADGCKCDRCWSYSEAGIQTEDGGFLCERCKSILGL
jgi:DNA-binding transcriptional LysR family regulator